MGSGLLGRGVNGDHRPGKLPAVSETNRNHHSLGSKDLLLTNKRDGELRRKQWVKDIKKKFMDDKKRTINTLKLP